MAQTAVSSSGDQVLRTIHEVPEPFTSVFSKYSYFNSIQSTVFNDVFYSDDSIAVSAPTGSGKTALFELAIVRLLMSLENSEYKQDYTIIYVAPMKAICEERLVEWHQKFSSFGVTCISVTGDTELVDYQCLKYSNIIITTPEKWDSITRSWRDNEGFIRSVRLFMIDEIHLLNDESRGSALEAAITRMKTIDAYCSENPLRFIAVSATVANIEDVAQWFEKPQVPAKHFKFEDNMRPVQLEKRVLGYPYNPKLSSPFKFDIMLSYKLHHILLQYSAGKPTLVFCSTRKSVEMTSKQLIQNLTISLSPQQKCVLGDACKQLNNSNMTETLIHGVGSHHAGMLPEHRRLIETLFRESNLPVLVTTSTLAMGVNLPAHLVVVKSTKYYANGEFKDYSESMISQMIGRAGRPQFDTSGTAVIMTTTGDKHKYENMVSGEQAIESYLRKHLVEFVNAEVVLRTITDLSVAMQWLSSTFLYIRARKNPRHYGLPIALSPSQLDKKLLEMCQIEINKLARGGMLTIDTNISILPTDIGILMARNCVSFETMKLFTQVTGNETLHQVLGMISKCIEFQEIRLRSNDKATLNLLNKCRNRQTIRFTLNGKIKTVDMKINCIIQAVLGCLEIVESWLLVEAQKVMRTGERLLLCLTEYLESRGCCYQALLNSIILSKCLHARIWENSQYVSRQLDGIGTTLSNALVYAGKTTFKEILEANPRDLERITKRKPPFGNTIQDQVRLIPSYKLKVQTTEIGRNVSIAIDIHLENASDFNGQMTGNPYGIMHLLVGDSENNILFHKKYNHLCMVENLNVTQVIEVEFGDEKEVFINFISQEWVGIDCQEKLVLFPDLSKPKPSKPETGVKPMTKSCKLVRKKSPQQQSMNKYFKNVKLLAKKKSTEAIKKVITQNVVPESEEIDLLDASIIDSSQILEVSTPSKSEIVPVEDDKLSDILQNSLKGILKVCNKKKIGEGINTDINTVLKATSSAINPIQLKTTEIKNPVESSSDFIRSHLAASKHKFKPRTAYSNKREILARRKDSMNSSRTMEFENWLYSLDTPIDLRQFAKSEKKKLTHDDNPQESNRTITWKSPVAEQPLIKHSPNLPKPEVPKQSEEHRPTLKQRISMYPLSDKEWSYNPKKFSDVLSKSLIETLEPEKLQSLDDFMSQTALNTFGLEDKTEKPDLNATISSNSSLPVSVKTKIADPTNYFSEVGCNSVADKIKKAIPAINDEMDKETSKTPEDNTIEAPNEKADTDLSQVTPEPNKGLKRRYSWEDDFLANDPMQEFQLEEKLSEINQDDGFKKFKELEETIVKQPNFKPSSIFQDSPKAKLSTKQTLIHDKRNRDLIEERLDPDQCLGFTSLNRNEFPDYDANERSKVEDRNELPDYDTKEKSKFEDRNKLPDYDTIDKFNFEDCNELPDYDTIEKSNFKDRNELPDYDTNKKSNFHGYDYLDSRRCMEGNGSQMDEGYVSRSLPTYGNRPEYMKRPEIDNFRKMDYQYPQIRRGSFGEHIPEEDRFNSRRYADRSLIHEQYPMRMQQYQMKPYPTIPKPIPQYPSSSFARNPSFRNSYKQNVPTPVIYNEYMPNDECRQSRYDIYHSQFVHPTNKIDDFGYGQHYDNAQMRQVQNPYERIRSQNPYIQTPYSFQNPMSPSVFTPVNRVDPTIHRSHHGNFRNNQFLDDSFAPNNLENYNRNVCNRNMGSFPQNDEARTLYNTGDKNYIMDKFLHSQPSLNLNHTLTSKDMYNQEFDY